MKSELLQELDARGFINQSSNLDGLDDALNAGRVVGYWGTDPTGDSLHVGHLASLMLIRWFQKYGKSRFYWSVVQPDALAIRQGVTRGVR